MVSSTLEWCNGLIQRRSGFSPPWRRGLSFSRNSVVFASHFFQMSLLYDSITWNSSSSETDRLYEHLFVESKRSLPYHEIWQLQLVVTQLDSVHTIPARAVGYTSILSSSRLCLLREGRSKSSVSLLFME